MNRVLFLMFILFSFLDFAISGVSYRLNSNTKIIREDVKVACQEDFCVMPISREYDLKDGDIIVSLYNDGYIRKVVSVKKNKFDYKIMTTPATMEDAFENLKMEYNIMMNPDDVKKISKEADGVEIGSFKAGDKRFNIKLNNVIIHDFDNNPKTTDDRITADGVLDFSSFLDVNINLEDSKLKDFMFKNRIIQNSDFKLNISSNVNIPLSFGKSIKLCEYQMAPVIVGPVVFTPVFSVILGVSVSAKGKVSINTTQKIDYTGGLHYLDGEWREISELNGKSFLGNVSFIGAKTSLKGYIGPKFLINFYNTLGPYINGFAYLKLTGDIHTKPTSLLWNLYGGVEANAGVNLKILTYFQKDFNKNLIDYSILIKSGIFEKKDKSVYDFENTEIKLLSPKVIENFEKGF